MTFPSTPASARILLPMKISPRGDSFPAPARIVILDAAED
jgi:hypothetical protein